MRLTTLEARALAATAGVDRDLTTFRLARPCETRWCASPYTREGHTIMAERPGSGGMSPRRANSGQRADVRCVLEGTHCETLIMQRRGSRLKMPISRHLRDFETSTTWPSSLMHLWGGYAETPLLRRPVYPRAPARGAPMATANCVPHRGCLGPDVAATLESVADRARARGTGRPESPRHSPHARPRATPVRPVGSASHDAPR